MHPLFANFLDNCTHVYDFLGGMGIAAQEHVNSSDEVEKKWALGRMHHINAARHHLKLAADHIKTLESKENERGDVLQ